MRSHRSIIVLVALAALLPAVCAEDDIDKVVEEETQTVYEAGLIAKGDLVDEDNNGWPDGMKDHKVRFIRLDHGGQGWDDGMGKSGADSEFLKFFNKETGLRVAQKGESHPISLLKEYPDDGFPPFVFLTGDGHMGRVSTNDAKILREYCLKGGMIIADAGSQSFHRSFVHFLRQVFPDKPLVDIASDDMVFQLPYPFPDGAPAFWHHGGRRALGIRHEGRWLVFYHPGDMNDAWKTEGFTDVTPELREAALKLGINLVFYAFAHWDQAVSEAGKSE